MTIVRTSTITARVGDGWNRLSAEVDRECGRIESDGNRVVSVSHATHTDGQGVQHWTVLIAYTKGESA